MNFFNNFLNSFFLIPEIYLLLNGLVFLVFLLSKTVTKKFYISVNNTKNIASLTLTNIINLFVFVLLGSFFLFLNLWSISFSFSFSFFIINNFILTLKLLVLIFTILIFISAYPYFQHDFIFKSFEFFILLLLSTVGVLFLLSSNDFLSLYLTLEFQSLCLYVLAGFKQNSILSIEAGLKYFILGSFASGLFLLGTSFIYGVTGTVNFFDLFLYFAGAQLSNDYQFLIFLGLLMLFSTFLFKFTAAPFHMWSPDVYEGAPTIVMFYFSIVPKIAFFGLIVRLYSEVFSHFDYYLILIFYITSLLSLLIGSLASLHQIKLKRFLAYSSISNVGYFLLALTCSNQEGFVSGLFYLFVYTIVVAGLFSIILSVRYSYNNLKLKNLNEFVGFLNVNVFYSVMIMFNFFSLIGMPPLAGFIGKFYLFFSSINSELFLLFLIACLSSIFSAIIYLKIIRIVFFNKETYFFYYTYTSRIYLLFSFIVLLFNFLIFFIADDLFKFFYQVLLVL